MDEAAYQGLVIDLGVSEGNDTAFYLSKGFRVIAVEADPETCGRLRERFRSEIAAGALMLLNFAASDRFGGTLEINVHQVHQGLSGINVRPDVSKDGYIKYEVTTIDWRTLVAQAGVPRYLKIDIEGNETPFLKGFLAVGGLPEFVSVECYTFKPIELLHQAGYRRFRIVNQNPPGGFKLPECQIEGIPVENPNFFHTSGPFGLDVFGDGKWTDFSGVEKDWKLATQEMNRTWFDCHAWKPN